MNEYLIEEKIKNTLFLLSDEKLNEIKNHIDSLIKKRETKTPKIIRMKGIWKDLGFEKFHDLEAEIKDIRKEAEKSLINKIEKWNM